MFFLIFQNEIYYPDKSYDGHQPLVIPTVRIEPRSRRRLSSDLTMMSEYDLPLDKQWEFPRDKYVFFFLSVRSRNKNQLSFLDKVNDLPQKNSGVLVVVIIW